jgi:hypothetical protein
MKDQGLWVYTKNFSFLIKTQHGDKNVNNCTYKTKNF